MSIELLPGVAIAPEVLLHRILEDMSRTKGVIVLQVDEHGAVDICMSQVTVNNLAYATMRLQSYTTKIIDGEPPEGAEYLAPKDAG